MKTVTVDELLQWAFVHELPKGGGVDGLDNVNSAWRMLEASNWGKIARFGELGTLIDAGRGDNYFIEQGEPHPDAVEAGREVARLASCDFVLPDGWSPLADWPDTDGLADHAVARVVERIALRGQARRGREMVAMVIGTAVLAKMPDTACEPSRVRFVERNGRPAWFMMKTVTDELGRKHTVEVDGYNARAGRPHRNAYRKSELSTDPAGDILARLDHQILVAVFRRLENLLPARMVAHRIVPGDWSATPWLPTERQTVTIIGADVSQGAKKSRRAA